MKNKARAVRNKRTARKKDEERGSQRRWLILCFTHAFTFSTNLYGGGYGVLGARDPRWSRAPKEFIVSDKHVNERKIEYCLL